MTTLRPGELVTYDEWQGIASAIAVELGLKIGTPSVDPAPKVPPQISNRGGKKLSKHAISGAVKVFVLLEGQTAWPKHGASGTSNCRISFDISPSTAAKNISNFRTVVNHLSEAGRFSPIKVEKTSKSRPSNPEWTLRWSAVKKPQSTQSQVILIRDWYTGKFAADFMRGLRTKGYEKQIEVVDCKILLKSVQLGSDRYPCEEGGEVALAIDKATAMNPAAIILSVGSRAGDEDIAKINSAKITLVHSGEATSGAFLVRQHEEELADMLCKEIRADIDSRSQKVKPIVVRLRTGDEQSTKLTRHGSPGGVRWARFDAEIKKHNPKPHCENLFVPELKVDHEHVAVHSYHAGAARAIREKLQRLREENTGCHWYLVAMYGDVACAAVDVVSEKVSEQESDKKWEEDTWVYTADFDSGVLGRMFTGNVLRAACGVDPYYYGRVCLSRAIYEETESQKILKPELLLLKEVKDLGIMSACDVSHHRPELRDIERVPDSLVRKPLRRRKGKSKSKRIGKKARK